MKARYPALTASADDLVHSSSKEAALRPAPVPTIALFVTTPEDAFAPL
jgi:hypothetical protein